MCATPVLARDVDDDGGGESEGHIAAQPLSKRQRVEQLLPAGPSTFEVIACGRAPAVVGNLALQSLGCSRWRRGVGIVKLQVRACVWQCVGGGGPFKLARNMRLLAPVRSSARSSLCPRPRLFTFRPR